MEHVEATGRSSATWSFVLASRSVAHRRAQRFASNPGPRRLTGVSVRASCLAATTLNRCTHEGWAGPESQALRLGEIGKPARHGPVNARSFNRAVLFATFPSALCCWRASTCGRPNLAKCFYCASAFTNTGIRALADGNGAVLGRPWMLTTNRRGVFLGSPGSPVTRLKPRHVARSARFTRARKSSPSFTYASNSSSFRRHGRHSASSSGKHSCHHALAFKGTSKRARYRLPCGFRHDRSGGFQPHRQIGAMNGSTLCSSLDMLYVRRRRQRVDRGAVIKGDRLAVAVLAAFAEGPRRSRHGSLSSGASPPNDSAPRRQQSRGVGAKRSSPNSASSSSVHITQEHA